MMQNKLSSTYLIHEMFVRISKEWSAQKAPAWIDVQEEIQILQLLIGLNSVRALLLLSRHRSQKIASHILSSKGELVPERVDEVLGDLSSPFFNLSLFPAEESSLMEHLVLCLNELKKNKNVSQLLKRIGLVFQDSWVERIVILTCQKSTKLTPYESRLAVLSAYLCPLRQTVGSCFATAPAILIQQQQAETFFSDLLEMLQKGELRRVIQGKQIAIPISRKFDFAEFTQKFSLNALLADPLLQFYTPLLSEFSPEENPTHIKKSDLLQVLNDLRKQASPPEEMSFKELFALTYEKSHMVPPPQENELHFKLELLSKQICPLLKAWEYTLSSFTQGGRAFSDWNLYISLGLSPSEPHGLGSAIGQEIDLEREQLVKKSERMKNEIVNSFDQLKTLEALLKQASSEREIARLKAQFQAMLHHHYSCKELQRDSIDEANHLFELFNQFLEWLNGSFEEFFQELFDPELFFAREDLTFDSPAGFRLFSKGGREGAFSWSALEYLDQFQQAIIEFFQQIEPLALERFPKRPDQKILDRWFKIIHNQLRNPRFLESSIERARRAHLSIIDKTGNTALESIQATPWCYLSGGSMKELVQYYFGLSHPPTIELFEPQDAGSLLASLHRVMIHSGLLQRTEQRLLAQSPNHGYTVFSKELFILNEKMEQHKKTQTILYDRHLSPSKAYDLITQFLESWPEGIRESFLRQLNMGEIRRQGDWLTTCLKAFETILPGPLLRSASSLLYAFFRKKVLHVTAGELYEVMQLGLESHEVLSCEEIYYKACTLFGQPPQEGIDPSLVPANLQQFIQHLQSKGFLPSSVVFGDTNWSGYSMAGCYDPSRKNFSLWRVDPWGVFGYPLLDWDADCFPGNWGVFIKPVEYTLLSKQFYLKV